MTDPLGPFQGLWDAWEESAGQIVTKPVTHFERAAMVPFDELREHLNAGDRLAAAREIVDVVSIALNALRMLGYAPPEIAEIARDRAACRIQGQTQSVLEKYEALYNI